MGEIRNSGLRRVETLDSLRGIAAVVVVLYHCSLVIPGISEIVWGTYLLRPLINGPGSVYIFFVLSGFVLYLTFEQKDGFRYRPYIIKRVVRILLPLAACVLASALMYVILRPQPILGLSYWFNVQSWARPATAAVLLVQALALNPWNTSFDNATWSVVHELRISAIFPILALAIRWRSTPTVILAIVISLTCFSIPAHDHDRVIANSVSTLRFIGLFACGAAIAAHRVRASKWLRSWSATAGASVAILGVTMLSFRGSALASEPSLGGELSMSIGSVLIVGICFAAPFAERLLLTAPLLWCGRVSYSLYLVHVPLLLTLLHVTQGHLRPELVLAAILPLALLVAHFVHLYIERPSMLLGRRLAGRKATAEVPTQSTGPLDQVSVS